MSNPNPAPAATAPELHACLGHAGARVSDWHCAQRTKLARRTKYDLIGELEAAVCLACPRGGGETFRRAENRERAKNRRASERRARHAAQREAPRSCIAHRELMVRHGPGWVCRSCIRPSKQRSHERRKAREKAAREARAAQAAQQ